MAASFVVFRCSAFRCSAFRSLRTVWLRPVVSYSTITPLIEPKTKDSKSLALPTDEDYKNALTAFTKGDHSLVDRIVRSMRNNRIKPYNDYSFAVEIAHACANRDPQRAMALYRLAKDKNITLITTSIHLLLLSLNMDRTQTANEVLQLFEQAKAIDMPITVDIINVVLEAMAVAKSFQDAKNVWLTYFARDEDGDYINLNPNFKSFCNFLKCCSKKGETDPEAVEMGTDIYRDALLSCENKNDIAKINCEMLKMYAYHRDNTAVKFYEDFVGQMAPRDQEYCTLRLLQMAAKTKQTAIADLVLQKTSKLNIEIGQSGFFYLTCLFRDVDDLDSAIMALEQMRKKSGGDVDPEDWNSLFYKIKKTNRTDLLKRFKAVVKKDS